MAEINPYLSNLSKKYLFPLIEERLHDLLLKEPNADVIRLGVGDIALPLCQSIVEGIKQAADEMGTNPHGYGPCNGFSILRERIAKLEYTSFGISSDEIFISDGINADVCAARELFARNQKIGIIDPAYPLYLDLTRSIDNSEITLIPLLEENGFLPIPPATGLNLVYLCSPHNPTGTAMTRENLSLWVNWALKHQAILFFDAAYQAFITDNDIPKTIYEIEGAKKVAIEFRSFSKSAGFTGLRLGYCIVPFELQASGFPLNPLWQKRQDIKTNGVSYISQMAGIAALSEKGLQETKEQVALYKEEGFRIKAALQAAGFTCYGGVNAPYIWVKIEGLSSWDVFDLFLYKHHILSIPGVGFGKFGEGFIRLSSFVTKDTVDKFILRIPQIKESLCELI